jgi:polar amino acid transport system permease protein
MSLLAAVPPSPSDTARDRAAARVKTRLGAAVVALVAAVAVLALLWWALWYFDGSLGVSGGRRLAVDAVLVAIGLLALAIPIAGVRAVLASRRAGSLRRATLLPDARVAAEDSKDSIWYVVGLGITALVVAFLAFFLASNDGAVRQTFFDWSVMKKSVRPLLDAFWLNIKIFVVAEILVLVWGLLVAVCRLLPGKAGAPVRFLAVAYTDVFRGMPAVLVIYLVVFGLGLADLPLVSALSREQQRFWLPVMALVLVYGAYVTEVYRAGLESIHWSQTAAARSLGLSHGQTLRYVIVPQAVRRIIPPLLNDFISLRKDTALVNVIGAMDAFNQAKIVASNHFNLSSVTTVAFLFVLITIPQARLVDKMIERDQRRTRAGG